MEGRPQNLWVGAPPQIQCLPAPRETDMFLNISSSQQLHFLAATDPLASIRGHDTELVQTVIKEETPG